jgi:flagellin-like protein
MVYSKSKKGAQGIGTLIIFIALILVAAVAAGVLIQTASNLQGKASNTGTQVQQRLATGFTVIEVTAHNTSDHSINKTDYISTTVRLSPGSDPVKLSDVTISLVTTEGKFTYNATTWNGNGSASTNRFNVTIVKGTTYSTGYIKGDDVVTFNIQVPDSVKIGENEKFTERIYPGVGEPIPVNLVTPPSMVNAYTVLK